jgi:hypothetical protein
MNMQKRYCRLGYLARLYNLDEVLISVSCEVAMFKDNVPLYDKERVAELKKSLEQAKERKKNLDSDLAARGWQICCGCGRLVPLFHRQYCAKCQEKLNAGKTVQN